MKNLHAAAVSIGLSCSGHGPPTPAAHPAQAPDPAVGKLDAPKPNFSPTPAAKVLGAWFDAMNSGDDTRIREFAALYRYPSPDELIELRKRSGGFQLVTLALGWELEARFVGKEKAGAGQVIGWLQVKDTSPPVIGHFELEAVPPEMSAEDAMERARKLATAALGKPTP